MNKYNQSALSNKGRRKIFEEAKNGGVIIQQKTTAGEVVGEFVLVQKPATIINDNNGGLVLTNRDKHIATNALKELLV